MKNRKMERRGIVIKNKGKQDPNNKKPAHWRDLDPIIDGMSDSMALMIKRITSLREIPLIMNNLGENKTYFQLTFKIFAEDMQIFGKEFITIRDRVRAKKGKIIKLEDFLEMSEERDKMEAFSRELILISQGLLLSLGDIIDVTLAKVSDQATEEDLIKIAEFNGTSVPQEPKTLNLEPVLGA